MYVLNQALELCLVSLQHARSAGLDLVFVCRQPQSKIAADVLPAGKAAKSVLMRKLMKKKNAGAGRAAKVSVEGRGIML